MIILVMGVSGSGKTTIGKLLADRLSFEFLDADDLHPPANVRKMAQGNALTDEDRKPWLESIRGQISDSLAHHTSMVIACSALKQGYREVLLREGVRLVYLKGEYSLLRDRMERREGHFMMANMLQSQFDALEEPEDSLVIDVSLSPEKIVETIVQQLGLGDESKDPADI